MTNAVIGTSALLCLGTATAHAQFVQFSNQTSGRLVVNTPDIPGDPIGVTTDTEEKDFAWGDVNQDGWTDLVVVRKQPFTSAGRRRNLLFINENGTLVDRTSQYATAVAQDQLPNGTVDQGFYTQTNDRDVVLIDVNGDGWLDIVTATTISDSLPKHVGHPRVYINLGEVGGVWQGFRFENARIPAMLSASGASGFNPRFCSIAAGDVTGDGYPDLYFGDYDSSGAGGAGQPPGADFNNKLLINLGAANPGYFVDESVARMGTMFNYPSYGNGNYLVSAFGAASIIADINNDGLNDVVKQTSLNPPQHVAIVYNNPNQPGYFINYNIVYSQSPYFVSAGDLNNDGRLDLVITDDNEDKFMINNGPNGQGVVSFTTNLLQHNFSYSQSGQFGSQSVIADLDADGWNDVLISDVDVDIGGCSRRTHIYHNLGNGPTPTIIEERTGSESSGSVAGIPTSMLVGTHNIAVFDVNNDGAKDIVIGRCSGTNVWINMPTIRFTYPGGRPSFVQPGQTTEFPVHLEATAGAQLVPGSGQLHVSYDGNIWTANAMTAVDTDDYIASLPAVDCGVKVFYYLSASLAGGTTVTAPPGAPASRFTAHVVSSISLTLLDEIEGSVAAWTVTNGPGFIDGAWEQAIPNATLSNGQYAAPPFDATVDPGVKCFVTENGPVGGAAGGNDVDGGPTHLLSPVLDLAGADGRITYNRWFYTSTPGDVLTVAVSDNNGATWVTVETVTSTNDGTNTAWLPGTFIVGDFIAPSSQVRVRFSTEDVSPSGIVEAGVDDFRVERLECVAPPSCPADVAPKEGDGVVNFDDILFVIAHWGEAGGPADINHDNIVNFDDVLAAIAVWGACP